MKALTFMSADPSGHAKGGSSVVRFLGMWFRIPPGYGCLSRESVVCCQVEASASCISLVQTSPTEDDVSECDSEASTMRKPWPIRGSCATGMKKTFLWINFRYGFNLYIYIYIYITR